MYKFPTRRNFLSQSIRTATVASAVTVLSSSLAAATTSTDKIKVGQIGVGHAHAKGKLEAFRQSDDFEITGVVEPNEELRQDALKSSGLEVEGFARRHFTLCGTGGSVQIEPLDNPVVRLALSKPRGRYTAKYQRIDVGPYQRYDDDIADLARIIRGEKGADYSSDHDLVVQKTILQASGLPWE